MQAELCAIPPCLPTPCGVGVALQALLKAGSGSGGGFSMVIIGWQILSAPLIDITGWRLLESGVVVRPNFAGIKCLFFFFFPRSTKLCCFKRESLH